MTCPRGQWRTPKLAPILPWLFMASFCNSSPQLSRDLPPLDSDFGTPLLTYFTFVCALTPIEEHIHSSPNPSMHIVAPNSPKITRPKIQACIFLLKPLSQALCVTLHYQWTYPTVPDLARQLASQLPTLASTIAIALAPKFAPTCPLSYPHLPNTCSALSRSLVDAS